MLFREKKKKTNVGSPERYSETNKKGRKEHHLEDLASDIYLKGRESWIPKEGCTAGSLRIGFSLKYGIAWIQGQARFIRGSNVGLVSRTSAFEFQPMSFFDRGSGSRRIPYTYLHRILVFGAVAPIHP